MGLPTDDLRKQTLLSSNKQFIMSGSKSLTAAVPDSSATKLEVTERLHQEVFELKEQLRSAIQLSED